MFQFVINQNELKKYRHDGGGKGILMSDLIEIISISFLT